MNKVKSVIAGITSAVFLFLLFGITTAVIPNPIFTRVTSVYFFDYFFLATNSILLGTYVGLHFYEKHEKSKKSDILAISGGVANIFVIGCPVCNVLIVSLIGTNAALNYFAPIQPVLGALSSIIILIAIYFKVKSLKECKFCIKK